MCNVYDVWPGPADRRRTTRATPPRPIGDRAATSRLAALAAALVLGACGAGDETAEFSSQATELATEGSGAGAGPAAPAMPTPAADASMEADRRIFEATIRRARDAGVDTLPIGDRVAALGRWFVGAEYVPGTLEVSPEQLVVNLRQFDCVTYVENMLALARVLSDPTPTFDEFLDELREIRYRGGVIAGYPSRLHYFSDWIADNDRLGIVEDVTRELGGVPLDETIDFMTTNRDAYPALESAEVLARIREQERALSGRPIYVIPEDRIAEVAPAIRDGDIIAATSSIDGLDVAHTGIALRVGGELHLMHAPLVGRNVEISELPLAERIVGIGGQDGIMVARPLAPR